MPFHAPIRPRLSASLAISLAVGLIVAACSSSGATAVPATGGSGEVRASLSEWKIDLSAASAPAGRVAFAIANQGGTIHEFLMIRTDMMADSLPVKNNMIDVDAMGGPMATAGMDMPGMSPAPDMKHPVGTVAAIGEIAAGSTAPLIIDELAAGHYVIVCDLPAHYQQGMRIDFTVGP